MPVVIDGTTGITTPGLTNSGTDTLSSGTANGVAYLNGSKVLTTGSALTFNGTTQTIGNSSAQNDLFKQVIGSGGANEGLVVVTGATGKGWLGFNNANAATIPGQVTYDFSSSTLNLFSNTGPITFSPSGTLGATLNSTGLGIGVTPSAWGANNPAIQMGGTNQSSFVGTYATAFGTNAYFDGTNWKYIQTGGVPALYAQSYFGGHKWFTAPSGTAGNAITFTQAMTLDASGNLALGTTVAQQTTANRTVFSVAGGSQGALINFISSTARMGYVFGSTTELEIASEGSTVPIRFVTNGAERARITGGGEFYIAGTTDQGAYNLQVNGTGVWGAGAYVNGSDARIKDDIKPLPSSLSVVQNLNPVTFRYKESWSKDTSVQPGFIAQELQQALAGQEYIDGVVMQGPEYMSVAYQTLIPVLTKAIQEQQALIEQLTTRIAALEAK